MRGYRFRADPSRIRVTIRHQTQDIRRPEGWIVQIGTTLGPPMCTHEIFARSPEEAINRALEEADRQNIPGIDLDLMAAYPHPHPECLRPPQGWSCTRGTNHDGPCAALPKESDAGFLVPPATMGALNVDWGDVVRNRKKT